MEVVYVKSPGWVPSCMSAPVQGFRGHDPREWSLSVSLIQSRMAARKRG